MRRKDREKNAAWARELLAEAEYATLCVADETGAPYSVPVSPVMLDGKIYIHCARDGKKLDCISRDDRVCISCVGRTRLMPGRFSTQYQSAVATGRARIVDDEREKTRALTALCEKYAPHPKEIIDAYIEKHLPATGMVCVELQAITGKENALGG